MATTHIVQGKTINAAIIAGYAKRMGNIDDTVTLWANAAVLEAASTGNLNWIESLLNVPMFRLADKKLSKAGKEVLSYIQANYPWIEFDKVALRPTLKQKRNEGKAAESPLHTHFVAVGVTADNVDMQLDAAYIMQRDTKFFIPFGDFRLTFAEFKSLEKPVKEEKPDAGIKAAAFAKQVAKVLEAHKEQRFIGTSEELAAALTAVKELYAALNHQQTKAAQAAIENGDGALYSIMPDAAARTDDVAFDSEAA